MVRLRRALYLLVVSAVGFGGAAGAQVPVGGQVVGPDGRGLAGIRVGLEPIPPDFERVEARLAGDIGPGPAVETATDADGFFELLAPRPGAWKVLAAWSDGEVTGAAPAYLAEEYSLRPLAEPTELPPLELQAAAVVEVKVVDEDGAPADARLGLADGRNQRDGWRARLRLARTGEDGIARLAFGAAEEPRLEVVGPNHPLIIFSRGELAASGGSVEIRLPPGGVAGTAVATDRGGLAVAGAVAYQGGGIVPLGRTDENGRIRLVVAPPEHEPPGVSFVTRDGLLGQLEPRFAPEAANEAAVVLEPLALLRGRVVDIESRDGVAGALVWVPGGPVAEADAHGRYELRLFPSRWLTVQAVAPGYAMAFERKELDAADPEDGPTIALAPAATVSGSVSDTEGRPLAGVDVGVRPSGNVPFFRNAAFIRGGALTTRSTRRGKFFLSGLPPSASCELVFRKRGFAPSSYELEGLAAFEVRAGLEVVLDPGRSGAGSVVDEAGAPVAGAEARLVPAVAGDPRLAAFRARRLENEEDATETSLTDSEGRFRLSHLAAGRYNLEVKAAGFAPFTVPGLTVDEGPGEMDFGTVVLVPGVRLEGVVRDREGRPLPAADIQAGEQKAFLSRPFPQPTAKTDGSGRFVVSDLEAGRQYLVVVSKSGYSTEMTNALAKEGATVEVVLRRTATISGRVKNEDREPVPGAVVFAEPERMTGSYAVGHEMRPARTDERGAFRLEGVDAGAVHLTVQAEGYQSYQVRGLEVPASGEMSDVEVVLARGAVIVGAVTRRDGTPVMGALVTCSPARESSSMFGAFQLSDQTDGEGRYRIDGAAPGPSVIAVQSGGNRQVSKSVDVGSGTQSVDLVVEEGFEVSGRVSDADGNPVAGADLALTATDAGRTRYTTIADTQVLSGADGAFTLRDVAAGRYLLTATKEGYARAVTPEPFEVAGGPVSGLEIELRRGATLSGRILGLEPDDLAGVVVHAIGGTVVGGAAVGGAVRMGLVDFEGRYSVASLGPGPWHVTARQESAGRQASGLVNLEEGQTQAELDLEFQTGFTLEGVVRSAGEPQSGLLILASGLEMGLGQGHAVSDSDGRFRMAHLPAGKYSLMTFTGDSQSSRVIEVPTEGEVVLELDVARISGHVRDEAGERPLPGASVRIERIGAAGDRLQSGPGTYGETDSQGYFSLGVEKGVYRVTATKAGYGPAETTVDAGGESPSRGVELRLVPTEGITFDVSSDSVPAPLQVLTAVLDPSGRVLTHGWVPVGEGGTVRLSTVPAGDWELAVQSADSAVVRAPITAPGRVGQIRLPRGGVLRIRIAALAGEMPLARDRMPQVRLVGPDGRPHYLLEALSGASQQWPVWNGEATIPRLVPGLWRFTVAHPDGRSWTGEAVVAAGETSEVVVP